MAIAAVSDFGAPSWRAELDLSFARRGEKTLLERRRHQGPLMVQRPFFPEPDGTCHVYVLHPPGGVAGGDELCVTATALPGARALLTTPAATKLYRTRGTLAELRQSFTVHTGATLEWLPQETLAFGGSRVTSKTTVRVEPGAHYLGWEITCLGRPASGDDFSTGSFRHCTEIWQGEKLVLIDRTHADGTGAARGAAWGWAGRSVYATLVATATSDALVAAIRAAVVPERSGDLFAVTAMSGVTVCRWLGTSAESARRALGAAWRVMRTELLHKPACPPRIWLT